MPAIEVYRINFAKRTFTPEHDVNSWGAMRHGASGTDQPAPTWGTGGLFLSAQRQPGAGTVNNSLYVVPPRPLDVWVASLPLSSRLLMRVEFDLPFAEPASPDVKAEPWVVGLKLKFANPSGALPEVDEVDQPLILVTCQFNNGTNNRNGVRLNDPTRAQDAVTNIATDLDSPLDYARYSRGCLNLFGKPTLFTLSFAFSGIQAGPAPTGTRNIGDPLGYAVGCGFLEMDGLNIHKKDLRLFSSTELSTGLQKEISALGVSLTTMSGLGKIMARLRRFTISIWDPPEPPNVRG